jgi:subtilisin family serine protease
VLGTIGAEGNNSEGVSGINWNVKMMTLTSNGMVDQIIESYSYALDQRKKFNDSDGEEGAFVVATNASFGIDFAFAEDFPIWCEIYDELGAEGVLNVGATTNEDADVDVEGDMPTTCTSDFLIGVTTTNEELEVRAGIGNVSIDLVAPGDEGFATTLDDMYREFTGTSSATPMVTGTIGLMYSLQSNLASSDCSPEDKARTMRACILSSVQPLLNFSTNTVTGGLLDVEAACQCILSQSTNGLSFDRFTAGPLENRVSGSVINTFAENYEIVIHNTAGQVIYIQEASSDNQMSVEVSNLASGLYFLSLIGENSKATRKFIKM